MPTYNLTKGANRIPDIERRKLFVVGIPIVTADIIAGNATLTANGKITAADVIQLFDIPADVVLLSTGACLETVISGTAANTLDIGIAGGDELFDGVALDAAVGTMQVNLVSDDWGPDNVTGVSFTATDTLDFTFVADEIIGSWILWLPGYETS